MSNITYAILQWDGADDFLEYVNSYIDDPIRHQKFNNLTDFTTLNFDEYGLKGAGGSKAYTLSVAAAAFNNINANQITTAVKLAYESMQYKPTVSLVLHPEDSQPMFLYLSEIYGSFEG